MEPKFRSIPITIIDFLAIFLPGFVWLLLIIATFVIVQSAVSPEPRCLCVTPVWPRSPEVWMIGILMLIFSLVIGNILKPLTMELAELFARLIPFKKYLLWWYVDVKQINRINKIIDRINLKTLRGSKYQKSFFSTPLILRPLLRLRIFRSDKPLFKKIIRNVSIGNMKFPFDDLHVFKSYYSEVEKGIKKKLNCASDVLPGHKLFSAAKRFIRSASPTLWEEGERMEAEVRMAGALFLASIYSSFLSVVVLGLVIYGRLLISDIADVVFWSVLSVLSSPILMVGWTHLRHNEVSYTYMNTLIALNSPTTDEKRESE